MSSWMFSVNGVSYESFESSAHALHTNTFIDMSSPCLHEKSSLYTWYAFLRPSVLVSLSRYSKYRQCFYILPSRRGEISEDNR